MKKLCIIEPLLADYRLITFHELQNYFKVDVIFSPIDNMQEGFNTYIPSNSAYIKFIKVPTIKIFNEKNGQFQLGVAKYIYANKPDIVMISANIRYFSFWTTICLCKLLNIKVYAHGHGLYKRSHINFIYSLLYKILFIFVTSYICYTEDVKRSLVSIGIHEEKLSIAENSLTNLHTVKPEEKTGKENGLLFIGRLRKDCKINLLLTILEMMRIKENRNIHLHIIGDGSRYKYLDAYSKTHDWCHIYGKIYDHKTIHDISRKCFAGCYPGNAGLSLVHLMSLSLPPIIHDNVYEHGPEAGYIKHEYNGLLFDHKDSINSLYATIKYLVDTPNRIIRLQQAAYDSYKTLTEPSLAKRLLKIFNNNLSEI